MNKQDKGREYEQSGMYPKEGKQFRLVALLLGLSAVIALLAIAALLLNILLI